MKGKVKPTRATLSPRVAELVRYVRHTNEFGSVLRKIWRPGSPDGKAGYERDDSHVCQLMDVAWFIQHRHLSHLDLLKVWKYCMVHDKPETYAGDVSAFPDKFGNHDTGDSSKKEERERLALLRLRKEWGRTFPDFLENLIAYERQEDEESRFVYALDKFLAKLNIFEDSGRTNHLFGVTLEDEIARNRPRVARHPFVLKLYDEFIEHCRRSLPDMFYQEDTQTTAAE